MNELHFHIMFLSGVLFSASICLKHFFLMYRQKACAVEFNFKTNSVSLIKRRKL